MPYMDKWHGGMVTTIILVHYEHLYMMSTGHVTKWQGGTDRNWMIPDITPPSRLIALNEFAPTPVMLSSQLLCSQLCEVLIGSESQIGKCQGRDPFGSSRMFQVKLLNAISCIL